jgi:hypothetical protein
MITPFAGQITPSSSAQTALSSILSGAGGKRLHESMDTYSDGKPYRLQDRSLMLTLFTAQIGSGDSTHPGLPQNKEEPYGDIAHLPKRPRPNIDNTSNNPFVALYRRWWGKPLDEVFTTSPDANLDGPGSDDEEDLSDDLLPGEPFLISPELGFLVRAEYLRVFDWVKKLYDASHLTHLAVVTGQPGIGATTSVVCFCD